MIHLYHKRPIKAYAVLVFKNTGRYDQTDVQVLVDIKKVIKKYGNLDFSIIDEFGNILRYKRINDKIIVKIPKITAKERLIAFLVEKIEEKEDKVLDFEGEVSKIKRKIYFGSKIEILEKIPWKEGHSQSLVRLGDYLYIASVDLDSKESYIFKFNLNSRKIEEELKLRFGSRYHISGMADEKGRKFIYVAISEYKRKVENPTIILKVYPDLSYEKFIEINDHIGAICCDKKRVYLFNWDADKLYIYNHKGKFIKEIDKKGWGPIQDCDYSYGKIYGTSQNIGRIDIIETRKFNVLNRIYTPKGLTNEGFDIDTYDPTIFWFLPDDGFIYKTKYYSISGYTISVKANNGRISLKRGNIEYRIEFDKDYMIFKHIINKEVYDMYKIKKKKFLNILAKIDRIVLHYKDLYFNYGLVDFKNKEYELEAENIFLRIKKYSKKIKYNLLVL